MEQRILFRGYSPPNINICATLKFFLNSSFPANSSYSLQPIKLKLDIQLDHDVEQHILSQGTVHRIFTELCPFEIFCKHFVSR